MSVYGGFVTRDQETKYNDLTGEIFRLLQTKLVYD